MIVTGDTVLSVQAAILLGQFLHLVSSLVPHEVSVPLFRKILLKLKFLRIKRYINICIVIKSNHV